MTSRPNKTIKWMKERKDENLRRKLNRVSNSSWSLSSQSRIEGASINDVTLISRRETQYLKTQKKLLHMYLKMCDVISGWSLVVVSFTKDIDPQQKRMKATMFDQPNLWRHYFPKLFVLLGGVVQQLQQQQQHQQQQYDFRLIESCHLCVMDHHHDHLFSGLFQQRLNSTKLCLLSLPNQKK